MAVLFAEGARGIGGNFAAGGEWLFARGSVGFVTFPDLDAHSTDVSASVGADLATDRSRRVFVCPGASIGIGAGPDIMGVDVSTVSLTAGGEAGVIALQTDELMIVPTFSLGAAYDRVTGDFGFGYGEATESDTSVGASIGVGFIFSQAIGIRPKVSVPLSDRGADPTFTISLSVNFVR